MNDCFYLFPLIILIFPKSSERLRAEPKKYPRRETDGGENRIYGFLMRMTKEE